jgi:hypothetical protein
MISSGSYGLKPEIANSIKISGDGGMMSKTKSMLTFMVHSLQAKRTQAIKNSIAFGKCRINYEIY